MSIKQSSFPVLSICQALTLHTPSSNIHAFSSISVNRHWCESLFEPPYPRTAQFLILIGLVLFSDYHLEELYLHKAVSHSRLSRWVARWFGTWRRVAERSWRHGLFTKSVTMVTTNDLVLLSHHQHVPTLYPPPLHIQKKSRTSIFRQQLYQKPSHTHHGSRKVCGPLDDIIDEITSDIWCTPPQYSLDLSFLKWPNPLKASATWTVTPLPVSRIPSNVPLTVRKQRNSRSTPSGSTFSSTSQPSSSGKVVYSNSSSLNTSWPSLDLGLFQTSSDYESEPTNHSACKAQFTKQESLKSIFGKNAVPNSSKPQSWSQSRLRKLTNALPLLRRGNSNTGITPNEVPPINVAHVSQEVVDDSLSGWMSRNAVR